MPTFYAEAEVDVDIHEFLSECSDKEVLEIYEELKEKFAENPQIQTDVSRSLDGQEFFSSMFKLAHSYHSISNQDQEILMLIAKRYI